MPRPKANAEERDYDVNIDAESESEISKEKEIEILDKKGIDYEDDELYSVVYEAVINGERRSYPVLSSVPTEGHFYVFQTYELDGNTRIIISHRDWDASFAFSKGAVMTRYGVGAGSVCNISLKLVDVMIDLETREIIGVYLLLMSPRFAQLSVNPKRVIESFTDRHRAAIKERILTNKALMLSFQLEEALERADTFQEALQASQGNIIQLAEEFSAPVIEAALAAMEGPGKMFEKYFGKTTPWYETYKYHIVIAIVGILTVIGLIAIVAGA